MHIEKRFRRFKRTRYQGHGNVIADVLLAWALDRMDPYCSRCRW